MPAMTSAEALTQRLSFRGTTIRWEGVSAWIVSFGVVFYLALRGGGYDLIVRSEVGLLAWWGVLLLAIVGLIPRLPAIGWRRSACWSRSWCGRRSGSRAPRARSGR